MRARGKGSSPGREQGSSRAMLVTARPSCFIYSADTVTNATDHCSDAYRRRGKSVKMLSTAAQLYKMPFVKAATGE